MTPFETIAAIIDAAGPAERPQEVAVPPARASAPKDKTGGRRQAAAPDDPSPPDTSGAQPVKRDADPGAKTQAPTLRIVAGTDADPGAREGESAQKSPSESCADGMAGENPPEAPARPPEAGDADDEDAGDLLKPRTFGFDIDKLNAEYALVLMGSKAVVFLEQPEALIEDQRRMLTIDAFKAWFSNRWTERKGADGKVKAVTWATAWLQSKKRKSYRGIEFHPDAKDAPGTKGYLNLWSGFAVTPAATPNPAAYKTFRDHLLNNVCRGDPKLFDWVFGFFAQMVQHPRERIGVAIVMRGKMGSGKTKVGEVFGSLIVRHYFLVDDPRYVTGQFNAHMATCLLLQADEAVWAGDKSAEGRLKGLITSPIQQIEAKGVDPIRLPNYVRLIMTSNEEWVVPAGKDERRFCVLDVDPRCAQNHEYFREMDQELAAGGLEALLADLLAFDLKSINLRQIPHTDALLEQKVRSLDSVESWWFERLMSGATSRRGGEWQAEIPCSTLFDDYIHVADKIGIRRKQEETVFGIKLAKLVPDLDRVRRMKAVDRGDGVMLDKRVWCYALPSLSRAREHFENLVNQAVVWLPVPESEAAGAAPSADDDVHL